MSLLSNADVARLRERYPTPIRRVKKALLPQVVKKLPRKEIDVCHHQCPVCKKEWSHELRGRPSSALDRYWTKCRQCKKEKR